MSDSVQVASLHASLSADTTGALNNLKAFRNEINNAGRDLGKMAQSSTAQLSPMEQAFKGIKDSLLSIGLAGAALGFAKGAVALTQTGDSVRKTDQALVAFSGSATAAEADINAVVRATDGMVNRFQAAQKATLLLNLGFAKNSQEIGRFTEIASKLGSLRGIGVDESIEQLNMILANRSFLRLDSLGISASEVRQRMAELRAEGKNVDDAFRFAFMEVAEQKLQTLNEAGFTTATTLGQMSVAWQDFSQGVGIGLSEVLESTAASLSNVNEAAGGSAVNFRDLGQSFLDAALQALNLKNALDGLKVVEVNTEQMAQAADNMAALQGAIALSANKDLQGAFQGGGLAELSRYLQDNRAEADRLASTFISLAVELGATKQQAAAYFNEITRTSAGTRVLADQTRDAANANIRTGMTIREMEDAQIDNKNAQVGAAQAMVAGGNAAWQLEAGMASAAAKAAILAANMAGVRSAVAGFMAVSIQLDPAIGLQQANAQIQAANNRLGSVRPDDYEGGLKAATDLKTAQVAAKNYQEQLDAIARAAERAAGGGSGGGAVIDTAGQIRDQLGQVAEDIKSIFESVFSDIKSAARAQLDFSEQVGEFDALQDEFGVRNQNAQSEKIRQLADVRNRALKGEKDNPWLQAFPELTAYEGRELAARAQSMIEAIRAGLRPDQIDLEGLMQDTREAIIGQRNFDAVSTEAAKRLMAEGFGMEEINAQLKKKYGDQFSVIGDDSGGNLAYSLVQSFIESIDSQEAAIATAAGRIGQVIEQNIMTGEVGKRIVEYVTSQVIEAADDALAESV